MHLQAPHPLSTPGFHKLSTALEDHLHLLLGASGLAKDRQRDIRCQSIWQRAEKVGPGPELDPVTQRMQWGCLSSDKGSREGECDLMECRLCSPRPAAFQGSGGQRFVNGQQSAPSISLCLNPTQSPAGLKGTARRAHPHWAFGMRLQYFYGNREITKIYSMERSKEMFPFPPQ